METRLDYGCPTVSSEPAYQLSNQVTSRLGTIPRGLQEPNLNHPALT